LGKSGVQNRGIAVQAVVAKVISAGEQFKVVPFERTVADVFLEMVHRHLTAHIFRSEFQIAVVRSGNVAVGFLAGERNVESVRRIRTVTPDDVDMDA